VTVLQRSVPVLLFVTLGMFAVAPFLVLNAPYESTMGLVQKIFYFHAPSGMVMFLGAFVSGSASAFFLFRGSQHADRVGLAAAELTVLLGSIVLVTGPLWARKAWGVWWQWDARLTSSLLLWLMFTAYLLVRRYGGAGSEKLAAAVAIFGMFNVPFVYISVNVWRTLHPRTTVVPSLGPGMREPFWFCFAAFLSLFLLLLALRVRLAEQQAELDTLFLTAEDRRTA
jgi:heme exporter protein C